MRLGCRNGMQESDDLPRARRFQEHLKEELSTARARAGCPSHFLDDISTRTAEDRKEEREQTPCTTIEGTRRDAATAHTATASGRLINRAPASPFIFFLPRSRNVTSSI